MCVQDTNYKLNAFPPLTHTAIEFSVAQQEVYDLMKDRMLVGHSLSNDLKVLMLSHPKHKIRDTCKYKEFRKVTKGRTPSLRRLTQELLGMVIQEGEHSPVCLSVAVLVYAQFSSFAACIVLAPWAEVFASRYPVYIYIFVLFLFLSYCCVPVPPFLLSRMYIVERAI